MKNATDLADRLSELRNELHELYTSLGDHEERVDEIAQEIHAISNELCQIETGYQPNHG